MTEYITAIISVCALISLASAISYKEMEESKTLKTAFAVILLYATVMPLLGVISDFDAEKLKFDGESYDFEDKNALDEISEEAFARGIKLYICEEFSLDTEEVFVGLSGFDSLQMKAEKVSVTLKGRAAYSDFRAIRERLRKNGFENCEVKIES